MAVGVNAATFDVLVLGFLPAPFLGFFLPLLNLAPQIQLLFYWGLLVMAFCLFFFL